MNQYAVVYQFLCSNCKCIMAAKNEIEAPDPVHACVRFSALTLPCRICHQTVTTQAVVKFVIYQIQAPILQS
jgi:hypothetical protein